MITLLYTLIGISVALILLASFLTFFSKPPFKGFTKGKILKASLKITAGWFNEITCVEIRLEDGQVVYAYLEGDQTKLRGSDLKFRLSWLCKSSDDDKIYNEIVIADTP